MIDLATLGRRLKDARTNCGLSQEEAAEVIGAPRTAIVHIEAGNRSISTVELAVLADLYKCPVSQFFREGYAAIDDIVTTRLRGAPELANDEKAHQEISRHLTICIKGRELEELLGISRRSILPEYSVAAPKTVMDAVEQGNALATTERRRLSIGENSVPDMADLLTAQGIWASGAMLPDEVSGVFLRHLSVGACILVNYRHARARKRFSYAHELCHALIDHSTEPKVSAESNRTELVEVRANAFAAAFLLPKGGVESFLSARDKGSVSREEQIVYDPSTEHGVQNVRAEKRTAAWLQAITFQDVASLSHCFGVSYSAATYRLKALGKLNNDELTRLLSEQNSGRQFLRLLRIGNDLESSDDPRRRDRELVSQVASLCLEAYRREQIKRRDVLAICRLLRVPGRQLLESADAALARAVAN